MIPKHGVFTISLDFELFWGVRDKRTTQQYKINLEGVRIAIPAILELFQEFGIHATWATVGFLFFKDFEDLETNIPPILPTYQNSVLSPYEYLRTCLKIEPSYHFAPDLLGLIAKYAGQEIGTHTFSHYYCLENGQTLEQFQCDLQSAAQIFKKNGLAMKCLVFPRNQWNAEYLQTLSKYGITCYRGNEKHWIYNASDNKNQGKLQRAFRLLDAYFNISGHNTYDLTECLSIEPFNLPSSRFLRPFSRRFARLEPIRINRIIGQMNFAAIHNRLFHLWWHPHNFGANTKDNINNLRKILNHFDTLRKMYGFTSLNMGELCSRGWCNYE